MAEATFQQFDVAWQNEDGTTTPASHAEVSVYSREQELVIANLTADGAGVVAPQSVTASPGELLRFSVVFGGRSASIAQYALEV